MARSQGRRSAPVLLLVATVVGAGGCSVEADPTVVRSTTVAQETRDSDAALSGFPGPETTGVPSGTVLTASGPVTVTQDGAVLDGLDISGCVVVAADDVVIRNTRVRCGDPDIANAVQVADGSTGLVVEDSEIDGLGVTQIGIGWGRYTLRRVEIHGTADGARLGGSVLIEDSWIHSMARIGDSHSDAVQSTSGADIVVRGNTLDPSTADDLNNAAVMLGSETNSRRLTDVLIEGNYLDGGNYSLNIRGDTTFQNIVIRDNVFGDRARYGPVIAPGSLDLDDDNVSGVTGAEVDVDPAR